jgi:small subunit ribosomal protein S6
MPLYESVFIARQDASIGDVEKMNDSFEKIIIDNGGAVVKKEYWGLRNLAYLIKKNRKGHYTMFGINAPYEAVKELERRLKLNENVLRHMLLRVETISDEPSVIMKGQNDDVEINIPVIEEEIIGDDNESAI